jgi:hypothetical protein
MEPLPPFPPRGGGYITASHTKPGRRYVSTTTTSWGYARLLTGGWPTDSFGEANNRSHPVVDTRLGHVVRAGFFAEEAESAAVTGPRPKLGRFGPH